MIPQLKLLLLLLNLFLGIAVIVVIYIRMRLYDTSYLRFVLKYHLIAEIFLLCFFLFLYFEINIIQSGFHLGDRNLLPYTLAILYAALALLLFTMYEIYRVFRGRKLQAGWTRFFYIVILSMVTLVYVSSAYIANGLNQPWILRLYDNLGALFIVAELVLLVLLWSKTRRSNPLRGVIRLYCMLFLSRYPVLLLIFLLPDPVRLFLLILYLHLVPLIWIRFAVDRFEKNSLQGIHSGEILERLQSTYHLTARESEILDRILQGKNNRQIQEELFVSYHTVKNHVYNIYQKLGISNRYQLFSRFGKKDQPSF